MNLRGAVCLVTGSSSGIGAAAARRLQAAGARVVVTGRDRERLEQTAARCDATALVADLADPSTLAALPGRAVAVHGRVDVLVNNAGVGWSGPFAQMPEQAIGELLQVDLLAAIALTRGLLPEMLERRRGWVVNVGSVVGAMGGGGEAVYAACKAGLRGFTEALRQESAGSGVGFSLIAPGPVDTPFFDRRGVAYERPFPRPASADTVAEAIVRAVRQDRPEVFVPGWLGLAARVRGVAPELYRPLVDRFG